MLLQEEGRYKGPSCENAEWRREERRNSAETGVTWRVQEEANTATSPNTVEDIEGSGMPPSAQEARPIPPQRKGHPNSLANLKPFQPGQVANPGGRPKSWLTILREEHGKGAERALVSALYGYALNRPELANRDKIPAREQVQAAQYLSDRIWGKVRQDIEVSGPGGGPLMALTMEDRRALYAFVVGGVGGVGGVEALPAGDDEVIEADHRALPMPGEIEESGAMQSQEDI